jgi:CheY-like chemotaxis protein
MPKQTVFNEAEKPRFKGEVLVCEDNALNQQVIREHLTRVGLNVVVANNGKEGVDFVKNRLNTGNTPFDLIFMDMHMPVMDGLEAVAVITEMGVTTPIVALTANIMADSLELYKKSGMIDTVGKPFTAKEMWRCLIKYFRNENTSPIRSLPTEEDDEINIEALQRIFAQDHQQTYARIMDALEAADTKTAYRLVHSLKSNAGYIKETRLEETTKELEMLLKLEPSPADLIKEHMDVVKEEMDGILEKFAHLL